jgi:hypothetical protein
MPRPSSIRVLGQRYKIDYSIDPKELLIWGEEDGEENKIGAQMAGKSNHSTQEIVVRGEPAVSHDSERDTLLHEALHAVFALTNLDQEMSDHKQELMVSRLTPAILLLMKDNPEFISYLMEEHHD